MSWLKKIEQKIFLKEFFCFFPLKGKRFFRIGSFSLDSWTLSNRHPWKFSLLDGFFSFFTTLSESERFVDWKSSENGFRNYSEGFFPSIIKSNLPVKARISIFSKNLEQRKNACEFIYDFHLHLTLLEDWLPDIFRGGNCFQRAGSYCFLFQGISKMICYVVEYHRVFGYLFGKIRQSPRKARHNLFSWVAVIFIWIQQL